MTASRHGRFQPARLKSRSQHIHPSIHSHTPHVPKQKNCTKNKEMEFICIRAGVIIYIYIYVYTHTYMHMKIDEILVIHILSWTLRLAPVQVDSTVMSRLFSPQNHAPCFEHDHVRASFDYTVKCVPSCVCNFERSEKNCTYAQSE
jgi:hypothetical protein